MVSSTKLVRDYYLPGLSSEADAPFTRETFFAGYRPLP